MIDSNNDLDEINEFEKRVKGQIDFLNSKLFKNSKDLKSKVIQKFDIDKNLFNSPYKKDIDSFLVGILSNFDQHTHITGLTFSVDSYHDSNATLKIVIHRPICSKNDDGSYFAEDWETDQEIILKWNSEGFLIYAKSTCDWIGNGSFEFGVESKSYIQNEGGESNEN